ncbi:MAG: hypothetical protein IJ821_06190 [Lachnospiraceae bacterium]|nr:hypothetical protein [Lachnospiraceae bacterium]
MTAKQAGAKVITILFPKAAAGTETFTVTKGASKNAQTVVSTKFSDDKTSAELTLASTIKADTYEVTSSDTTLSAATFTGEESKLQVIKFLSENLVAKTLAADGTVLDATVAVKGYDQFEAEYALDDPKFNVSNGGNAAWTKGVLTIESPAKVAGGTTGGWTVGASVPVSVINGTTVATATLKVSAASAVSTLEVGELTTDTKTAAANTTGRVDADDIATAKYYFPINAVDQYGEKLTAAQLNAMASAGTPSLYLSPANGSTSTSIISPANVAASSFTALDDGSVALYVTGAGTLYGEGSIVITATTGVAATAKATVAEDEKISKLDISAADLIVNSASSLTIDATDQYGDTVDLYKATYTGTGASNGTAFTITYNGTSSTIKASDTSAIAYKTDAAKKTIAFTITPATATFTATVTPADVVNSKIVTFKAAAVGVPDGITGLASSVNTTLGLAANVGANGTIVLDEANKTNIVFYDTNGKAIAEGDTNYPKFVATRVGTTAGTYLYTISDGDGSAVTTYSNGTITANQVGTEKYTITLFKDSDASTSAGTLTNIADYTFTVTVADEAASYEANLKEGDDLLHIVSTTNTAGEVDTDTSTIEVYSVDASGNKTKLSPSKYSLIPEDLVVNDSTGVIAGKLANTHAFAVDIEAGKVVSGTDHVKVLVNGTVIGTVDVPYSSEASKGVKVAYKTETAITTGWTGAIVSKTEFDSLSEDNGLATIDAGATLTDLVITEATSGSVAAGDKRYTISIIDQYGLATKGNTIVVGNGTTSDKLTTSEHGLATNGTKNGTAAAITTAGTYTITVSNGSATATVKIVVKVA